MSRHPFAASASLDSPVTPEFASSQAFATPLNPGDPEIDDPASGHAQFSTPLRPTHRPAVDPVADKLAELDIHSPPVPVSEAGIDVQPDRTVGTGELSPSPERQRVQSLEAPAPLRTYDDLDRERDDNNGTEDEAVHFVLLAEFDIDLGSTISQQYPYPTGTDEHRLAELMLPDGAHLRAEDWTVFYLGQDEALAVDPMLAHETSRTSSSSPVANRRASMYAPGMRPKRGAVGGGLLYVLSCVRCKADKTVKRGALVKSLAICTPHPWIHVFKPILLLALEEYFRSPSPEVLAHLYDCCNSGQILVTPRLSRAEKILLRLSDRKDLFEERYDTASTAAREMELEAATLALGESGDGLELVRRGSRSSHLTTPSVGPGRSTPEGRKGNRDTHYFDVDVRFRRISVPMKIPLATFEEEVGDYSLIELINTFSNNVTPFPGPYHSYLHTNGAATHPIILLINALLAHKRVLVLGTQYPANHVARTVLSVCALATGCGQVLRGITETALPYCNLSCYEMMEGMNGFVAGITNPRFVDLPIWDVCCDIETGKITVNKNMRTANAASGFGDEASPGDTVADHAGAGGRPGGSDAANASTPGSKMVATQKGDCVDNQFMEDIIAAIGAHYGEMHIRQRMTDYIARFTKLASYQEYQHHGTTKIGYPSTPFREARLGSGTVFLDESKKQREMWANGHRIDAWRKTKSYTLFAKDWAQEARRRHIPFDVQHQIARLRIAQNMGDAEAEAIYASLAQNLDTYDQVLELLKNLPAHLGGLTPLATGLFHRWVPVRESAVDVLLALQNFQLGRQAVSAMNYFHRKAFLQSLDRRQMQLTAERMALSRSMGSGQNGFPVDDTVRREGLAA